jgi:hypothetical protein
MRGFLKWYNRKMYLNVSEDYQAELYGLSQYSSDKYDFIAPNFKKHVFARSS